MLKRIFVALFLIIGFFVSGCSTYVENQASFAFDPIYPEAHMPKDQGAPTGAIYAASKGGLFAKDRRAREVGDILTVTLSETFSASKSQSASSSKTDAFDVDLPVGLPNLFTGGFDKGADPLKAGTSRSFSGAGAGAQSNSLSGFLTVTVTRVFDNGNMEIAGQKKMLLNNGDEYVRLTGLVRPEDISATNLINSNRIADAEITYVGAGELADSSKQGWLSRAMRTISPF